MVPGPHSKVQGWYDLDPMWPPSAPTPKSRVDMIWILCGHLRPQHQRPRVISFGHYVATFGLTPTCRGVVIWTLCVATFCLPEVSRGMTLRHPGEVYPIEMDAARHNPSTSPRGIDHRNHGAHACNSQSTSPWVVATDMVVLHYQSTSPWGVANHLGKVRQTTSQRTIL